MLAIQPRDLPAAPRSERGWPWTAAAVTGPRFPNPPRITVVTPSYNQAPFVAATLRSVLLQDYPDLEYIVIDGGSADGAADEIGRYARWLTYYVSEPDRGQSEAIHKGFARASGEIIGWLNSDDRLLPGALWAVADAARSAPDAVAWVGNVRSVTTRGRLIYPQVPRGLTVEELADWGHAGQFSQPGFFFRRAAYESAGPVDPALHYAFDVDLFLRIARLGRIAPIDRFIAEETIHPEAKTFAQRGKSLAELHLVQIRNGFESIAMRRMSEELQAYETLRRGTLLERARWQGNLLVRRIVDGVRHARQ